VLQEAHDKIYSYLKEKNTGKACTVGLRETREVLQRRTSWQWNVLQIVYGCSLNKTLETV